MVTQHGNELVDLEVRGISEVSVEKAHGRELLTLEFRDEAVGTLAICTNPTFSMGWTVGKD